MPEVSAPPYMKLFWGDYHKDTRHLTRDQHGAYFLLIGEAWRLGGSLPADDGLLALWSLCTTEEWANMKGTILAFFSFRRGRWMHDRVREELAKYESISRKRKSAGKEGGSVRGGKDRGNPQANAKQMPTKPEPEPEPEPESSDLRSSDSRAVRAVPADEFDFALRAYNDVAKEVGLPPARSLTAERRKHLRARLAEHGREGWVAAMEGLRAPFCLGENDRGWKANLDFALQAKSCAKLVENAYATGPPVLSASPGMLAAAAREAGFRMAMENGRQARNDTRGDLEGDNRVIIPLPRLNQIPH